LGGLRYALIKGVDWIISRVKAMRAQSTERDLESIRARWARSYPLRMPNNSSEITQGSVERMNVQLKRAVQKSRATDRGMRRVSFFAMSFTQASFIASFTSNLGLSLSEPKDSSKIYPQTVLSDTN
jgi:hypothetical protein